MQSCKINQEMNKEFLEILTGFKRTLNLVDRNERKFLVLATFLMLVAGILTNLPAVILGKLVDKVVDNPSFSFNASLPFVGSIIIAIIIRESLTIWRKYLVHKVTTQTDKKQTVRAVEHLLKTELETLGEQQIGSLNGRIFRSIQGLVKFFPIFFSGVAALGIAFFQKPFLTSFMILVIPLGLFIIIKQISSQKGIRVSLIRGKERIDGSVVEMLGGIETIRALNTTSLEVAKITEISEGMRQTEIKHHLWMSLFDAAKYFNEGFFYILVITISIFLSAQGVISKGDILVYSILFQSIVSPLREIHRILDQAHESSIAVNDLYELLARPIDQSFTANQVVTSTDHSQQALEITNLSFSFAKRQTAPIHSINLSVKKGENIGIAGASGCGKTTFIKLILKLVHGYQGEIKLFGKDLTELTRANLAEKIAYVPQKPYIFSGSIRENVAYGAQKADDQQILNALKKANIFNEVQAVLGGLEGRVGENGNNLSGGQRQRLAIARLLLKSPELIILDEATSALDNTNEAKIQSNLTESFRSKTIIIIAHRLTTLKDCDRILVFDKGRIVQEGTYQGLSRQEGLFRNFLKQGGGKKRKVVT